MTRCVSVLLLLSSAAPALAQQATTAPVGSIAALRQKLQSNDRQLREQAYERIKQLEKRAEPLIPDLIPRLNGIDSLPACYAISAIGSAAIPALSTSLTGRTIDTRAMSAMALGRIGAAAESTIPTLITLTQKDRAWYVRSNAAEALGQIGRRPDLVLPVLVRALDDRSPWVVIEAHGALGRFGAKGLKLRETWQSVAIKKGVPPNIRCLAAGLAAQTGWAKRKLVREGMVDVFRMDVHDRVRRVVVDVLKEQGTKARWSIPFLIDALQDKDSMVRSEVAKALGRIAKGSELSDDVVKALTLHGLSDTSSTVRQLTTYALERLASPKHPVTEARLRELQNNDPSKYVRRGARDALKAFEATH